MGKKSAIGEVVKPGDYRALREGQNSLLVGKAHGGALGVEKVEKGQVLPEVNGLVRQCRVVIGHTWGQSPGM